MLKNYLKITFRNILKHKSFSAIIIFGLALGLALFTLAVQYTDIHLGFDQFHADAERIYALVRSYSAHADADYLTMKIPAPIKDMTLTEFPEIESATRFIHESDRIIRHDDKKFYENRVWYVDPNFLTFFSFDLISGDPETVLANANSVVINESTATKYFGTKNPIGQDLILNRDGRRELMVTGVCRNVPVNSSLQFDFLISSQTFDWLELWEVESTTFFKLKPDTDHSNLEKKFPPFIASFLPELQRHGEKLSLFPLTDIHLHSLHILHHFGSQCQSPSMIYLILGTGIVILLIVCVNFMNLSSVSYMTRIREVGLRKAVGASHLRLIQQYLSESVFISLCAFPLAILLYEIIRPSFLAYIGLVADLSIWHNLGLIIILLAVTIGAGLGAGAYPAFFLSSLKPESIFKEHTATGFKGAWVKKMLVILQFTLTILLIIFSLTQHKQYRFLTRLDLGYDRSQVGVLEVHPEMFSHLEALKQKLLQHPQITAVGGSNGYPFNWGHEEDVLIEGMSEEDAFPMKTYHVDYGLIEALDMQVTQGRSFSQHFSDPHAYILSEMAVKRFGWENPLGKTLSVGGQKGTVVGVIEDFHFQSVFFKWQPSLLYLQPSWTHLLCIRMNSLPNDDLRSFVEQQWHSVAPDFPFEYSSLNHVFEDDFRVLTKVANTFHFISILSLFISSLGLIALASFTTKRKTKEIGIRKVLGASIPSLLQMLVCEFTLFVLIANGIAIPLAVWGLQFFLKSAWVERITLNPIIFIIASGLSFVTALISVIFQSLKAATTNPVEALRYE